jgi:hypothetical protein
LTSKLFDITWEKKLWIGILALSFTLTVVAFFSTLTTSNCSYLLALLLYWDERIWDLSFYSSGKPFVGILPIMWLPLSKKMAAM